MVDLPQLEGLRGGEMTLDCDKVDLDSAQQPMSNSTRHDFAQCSSESSTLQPVLTLNTTIFTYVRTTRKCPIYGSLVQQQHVAHSPQSP